MPRTVRLTLVAVLLVLAVLAVITGALYLHDTPKTLPSFLPGHRKHGHYHYRSRAVAGFVAAAVLLVLAGFSGLFRRRSA